MASTSAAVTESRTGSFRSDSTGAITETVLSILAIVGILVMLIAPLFFVPAEDATILFQYSDNWANTGQITYFAGGPRVEGATDFLWMAILAGFRLLHVSPVIAIAALNTLAAIAIACLLIRLANRPLTSKTVLMVVGIVMLAPQLGGALAGFSVLPFAALILVCALFFHTKRDAALAVSCLLLCLFRPDGTVFALPMIALSIFRDKFSVFKRLAIYFALFVVPGLLYFVWRWKYFGEFLPLPFLVKSDTPRFLGIALGTSNIDILKYLGFDAIFLGMLLGSRLKEWANLRLLIAVGIFPTLFYLAMRLDQNIADRFFAYLLICAAILVAINWDRLKTSRAKTIYIFCALWLLCLSVAWGAGLTRFFSDGYRNITVSIARELKDVKPNGTLALSEAGRVAYFSQWPTTDLWGLNTPLFAHRLFAPSDIASVSPDLLVLYYPQAHHDCRFQPGWDTPHTQRTWPNLAQNTITGIHEADNYDLWMVPSSGILRRLMHGEKPGAGEYQCWFVKRTFTGHDQVQDILVRHKAMPEEEFARIRAASPGL